MGRMYADGEDSEDVGRGRGKGGMQMRWSRKNEKGVRRMR